MVDGVEAGREEDRHLPSDLADRLKANGCVPLSIVVFMDFPDSSVGKVNCNVGGSQFNSWVRRPPGERG